MTCNGHTPTSFLAGEYYACLQRYGNARKKIALLAVDMYLREVAPARREVAFKICDKEDDAQRAVEHNVKKVHGYFCNFRNSHLPFSFGHYVARAIDDLYDRNVVDTIKSMMDGSQYYASSQQEDLARHAERLLKASYEAAVLCTKAPGSAVDDLPPTLRDSLRVCLVSLASAARRFIGQLDRAAPERSAAKR